MVLFNYSTKELTAKVVYYGPGLCGKTTNLQWIHEKLPIKNKGKMVSLATEADRTLFFDFLPIELGTIRGMKTRIQLYTVPGQVFYNATRRMVLKGADCVVFVADSQEPMIDANLDALANLRENLEANDIDPDQIPVVLQYNKRDLPNAAPLAKLEQKLNPNGWLSFEACAKEGRGVEETLKGVTGLVFRHLATRYGGAQDAAAAARPAAPPPPSRGLEKKSGPSKPVPPPRSSPAPRPTQAPAAIAGAETDDLFASLGGPATEPPVRNELDLGGGMGLDLGVEPAPPAGPAAEAAPELLEELTLEDPTTAPGLEPAPAPEPPPPDLSLEELAAEPEFSLEELTAEPAAAEPGPITLPGLEAAPEPAEAFGDLGAELDLGEPATESPELELPVDTLPHHRPGPLPSPAQTVAVATAVSVPVASIPGQAKVSVPIEVVLKDGTRMKLDLQVTLHLNRAG